MLRLDLRDSLSLEKLSSSRMAFCVSNIPEVLFGVVSFFKSSFFPSSSEANLEVVVVGGIFVLVAFNG